MLLCVMRALRSSCRVGLQNVKNLYSDLLRQNVCGKCNNLKRDFAVQDLYEIIAYGFERNVLRLYTRRPASAGRTARRHVLPMGVGLFAFGYRGNGATPCQYIDTTRKAIDCATTLSLTVFYIMKLCSRLLALYCRNCPKDDKFRKLGAA